jgi:hypothetical protein
MNNEECKGLYAKLKAAIPKGHRTIRYPMDACDPELLKEAISAVVNEIVNANAGCRDTSTDMFKKMFSTKIGGTDFIAALAIDGGDINERYVAFLGKSKSDIMHNWMFELKNVENPQTLDYVMIIMNRDIKECRDIIYSIDSGAAAWLNLVA